MKRHFLALSSVCALSLGFALGRAAPDPAVPVARAEEEAAEEADPAKVLASLEEGNRRFVEGKSRHDHQDRTRVRELVKGQHPRACVLACADSRVAPEIVLDQGLGDLFDVRVAGNVADPAITGSLEYAVEHFHTPLILVLGHRSCGAVTAAVDTHGHTKALLALGPNLRDLVERIAPVLVGLPAEGSDTLEAAIEANARFVADELEATSEILRARKAAKQLDIVPAVYDLEDGGKLHVLGRSG
jgi:carbonic anhydrase